jgi:hypothetical protein
VTSEHSEPLVPPGSGDSPEAVRERLAEIHEDDMRREQLLAEHRRRAGEAAGGGVFNPAGGFPSGFNRE